MKFLSLNCQRAHNTNLSQFLAHTLKSGRYDFLLLQEVTNAVLLNLNHAGYTLLTAHNEEAGKTSELCIVYRTSFKLRDSKLMSIEQFNKAHAERKSPTHGFLYADFDWGGKRLRVGSVHLHAGLNARARRLSLAHVRAVLYDPKTEPITVLGGDYNFGPFEKNRGVRIMSPLFVCVTRKLGATLDSRYTEPGKRIVNRTAVLLAKLGLRVTLATDHFFANAKTATLPHSVKILPDRVSDHSPIELVLDA